MFSERQMFVDVDSQIYRDFGQKDLWLKGIYFQMRGQIRQSLILDPRKRKFPFAKPPFQSDVNNSTSDRDSNSSQNEVITLNDEVQYTPGLSTVTSYRP